MSYKTSKDLLKNSNCLQSNPPEELVYMKLPAQPVSFINPPPTVEHYEPKLHVDYVEQNHSNSGNPEVWGPAFWFSLHNGATKYPINATPTWKERMKNFIIGIPVMVPCEKCSVHATAYIEKYYDELESIVSGRDTLFEFFCNFHNYVNKRLNKPEMNIEDAITMYSTPTKVTKLQVSYV